MPLDETQNSLVTRMRARLLDIDPDLNILDEKLQFSDEQLLGYLEEARIQINEEPPMTYYNIYDIPVTGLLIQSAMIFALKARSLLHLRNQITYNDAGLSVGIEDKAMYYQQIASSEEASFRVALAKFKSTQAPGFYGIGSPLGWY